MTMEQQLNSGNGIPLYDSEIEMRQHLASLEMLSIHTGEPVESLRRLYETVLMNFKRVSTVKDFLPIIVGRRVADIIRERRHETS